MTFFKELEKIFPYLKSIRKLKGYLSIDVEISQNWKIPKKFTIEGKVVEQENPQPNMRLISFVSEFDEKELSTTVNNIKSIIDYNKELEEKEVLFVNKVEELKKIFEKQKNCTKGSSEYKIFKNFWTRYGRYCRVFERF